MQLPMPNGFFWELSAIQLPLRASGGLIMDATGIVVANCPNGSYADALAFHVNNANGIHGTHVPSTIFPYGGPQPGQRNADDMGMPATAITAGTRSAETRS